MSFIFNITTPVPIPITATIPVPAPIAGEIHTSANISVSSTVLDVMNIHYTKEYTCPILNIKYVPTELVAYKPYPCDLLFLEDIFIDDMRGWVDTIVRLWQAPTLMHDYLTLVVAPDWVEVFRWAFSKVIPKRMQ